MAEYEGEYEPEYEEGFLEEEGVEYYEQPAEQGYDEYGEQGYAEEGQGEEISINIPAEEDYPSFDEIGLTDDAIRIIQEFVLNNGHIKLTADQLAEAMRDVDGNEHPDSIQFARMVLDVWRMRNPHLEAIEEEYPHEAVPEAMEHEGHYEDAAVHDDAAVLSASYAGEEVIEVVNEVIPEAPLERRRSSIKIVSESGYSINVPLREDYQAYDETVDFAHRLVENHVVRSGDLKLPAEDLAASLLDPHGQPVQGALSVAYAVLDVWSTRNPHLEVIPRPKPSPFPPVPSGYKVPHDGQDLMITVPPDEDFPAPDRFGLLSTITSIVFQHVMETSAVAISAEQVTQRMAVHGGDQFAEAHDIALAVLDAWRRRNPQLPTVAPSKPPPPISAAPYEVIEKPPAAGATVSLPGGGTLVIPLESEYPAFDKSGLTDDAIRIVREFVMETGSLGITEEQVAGQMVDFLGNSSPEALPIASSVLAVWRAKNPALPLTSVKEIYPALAPPAPAPAPATAPAPAVVGSALSAITEATSKNAVIPEGAGVLVAAKLEKPEVITYGIPGDQKIHVERDDSRDVLLEAELAVLLDKIGCEVEPFLSPLFGPGIRIHTVSSRSILYKSGVEPGDAIIEMDGFALTKTSQLYSLLSRLAPGTRFSWRFRRHSPAGSITEFTVIQTIPEPKLKAVEPRWAGLPKERPYRSHSNLLPTDPGFAEAYSQIPIVVGPPALSTQKLWNTRVVDGGIIPAHALERASASTVVDTLPVTVPYQPASVVVGPSLPPFPRTVAAPSATYTSYAPVCNPCATCDPVLPSYASARRIVVPGSLAPRQEVIQLTAGDVEQVKAAMVNKYVAKIDRRVECQPPVRQTVVSAAPVAREVLAPVQRSGCSPCAVGNSLVASRYTAGSYGRVYGAASPVSRYGVGTSGSYGSYVPQASVGNVRYAAPSTLAGARIGSIPTAGGCSSCAV